MAVETNARFVEEATESGFIDSQNARDLVKLFKSYQGQGLARSIEQVAVDHGFLTTQQAREVQMMRGERQKPSAPQIGPYRILDKLGSGGMAEVFKAQDPRSDQTVALKVLHHRLSEDQEYLQRFYREAQAAAKLNHTNIIRAFEAAHTPEGQHYFAMEYVEGTTLNAWLKKARMVPEREGVKMGIQIAKALDHAQEQGIVHRDIKPDNIMVTRDGRVKLTDLGLAKQYSDNRVTEIGVAIGTPQYISPEQARGDCDVDVRSDIYSLGATIYHAITGQPPFSGNSAAIIMVKHLNEAPQWPQDLNPALSDATSQVLLKMLSKSPEDRYQTPKELLRDLSSIYHGLKGAGSATVSAVQPRGGTSGELHSWRPASELLSATRVPANGQAATGAGTPDPYDEQEQPETDESGAFRQPGRQFRGADNKSKFVFLGAGVCLVSCLCVFTLIQPHWPRALASAIGLAKPPSQVNDEALRPVAREALVKVEEDVVVSPTPRQSAARARPPRRNPQPEPLALAESKASRSDPKTVIRETLPISATGPQSSDTARNEVGKVLEQAKALMADHRYLAAQALLSEQIEKQQPDSQGVFGSDRAELDKQRNTNRDSARAYFASQLERAGQAVAGGDLASARKAIAAAKTCLSLQSKGRHTEELARLERSVASTPVTKVAALPTASRTPRAASGPENYLVIYDQYKKIANMISQGDYAQALRFLDTLPKADPEEIALWKHGIETIRGTFERAARNASTLVGKTLRVGPVSGQVVAVKAGRIHLKTRGVEVARPLSELSENQQLALAGIKLGAQDPDTQAQLGVLAFFRGILSSAKARLEIGKESDQNIARFHETIERMAVLTREREAGDLIARAQKSAKAKNWRGVREALGEIRTGYSETETALKGKTTLAEIESTMAKESLDGIFSVSVKRSRNSRIEATYGFETADELWDWWRSGYVVYEKGAGIQVNGDFWLSHRAPFYDAREIEIHLRVDSILDPVRSFIGWGVHAAAQVCVPTEIENDLPRGYYGRLNTLQGKDSGIWVGGGQPRVASFSSQKALKPATDYVLTITRDNDRIAWSINDEIFLKAKNLKDKPGPRFTLFGHKVKLTVTRVQIAGSLSSSWLKGAKKEGDFLADSLPGIRKALAAGDTVPLLHRGLPVLWSPAPGEWKIRDGQTVWASYYRAPATRLPFAVANGLFEARFRFAEAKKNQRGFEVAFRDTGAYRYALRIDPSTSQIALVRHTWAAGAESEEILKAVRSNLITGDTWHPFALAFRGSRIQVTMHKTPVLSYDGIRTASGQISLLTTSDGRNSTYEFSDMTLRSSR